MGAVATVQKKSTNDDVIRQYLPLVKRIAYHMMARLPASVEVDDLIQVGLIGLMDAVSRFDGSQGAQFESYATQRIRGAMLDDLRDADWLPRHIRQKSRQIESAINKLAQRHGRPPTELEISAEMGISLADYQSMLGDVKGNQLLYYEDFSDEESSDFLERYLVDDVSDPLSLLEDDGFRKGLIQAIEDLPEREKNLMGMYYEQDMNLKEIGAVMGVSESRICQLHSQAVARLRAKMKPWKS
ncbi:RNA polymerase sigma factor FliA [Betaproteobacteria bacterium SCN2]|jgi:RNA polymerase sigma factor for flagellar operon FliA|nr:RNA polymerase sigma factor FliA [Betaproteobacteria bacterium SCN2]